MDTSRREAAALVPFYKKDDVYYFFLQLRDEGAPTDPGRIGFFGGGIEGEETPLEAVTRETKEELAIDITPFFFKTYSGLERTSHVFLLEVPERFKDSVTILEGEDGFFLSEEEANTNPKVIELERTILKEVSVFLKN